MISMPPIEPAPKTAMYSTPSQEDRPARRNQAVMRMPALCFIRCVDVRVNVPPPTMLMHVDMYPYPGATQSRKPFAYEAAAAPELPQQVAAEPDQHHRDAE